MLGSSISLIWCHFYSCLLSNWLFAEKFSNCSYTLTFEAKINCNTIKQNVPKWRLTCTGLKFDLLYFYGPQSHILSGGNIWGPCIITFLKWRQPPVQQMLACPPSSMSSVVSEPFTSSAAQSRKNKILTCRLSTAVGRFQYKLEKSENLKIQMLLSIR